MRIKGLEVYLSKIKECSEFDEPHDLGSFIQTGGKQRGSRGVAGYG